MGVLWWRNQSCEKAKLEGSLVSREVVMMEHFKNYLVVVRESQRQEGPSPWEPGPRLGFLLLTGSSSLLLSLLWGSGSGFLRKRVKTIFIVAAIYKERTKQNWIQFVLLQGALPMVGLQPLPPSSSFAARILIKPSLQRSAQDPNQNHNQLPESPTVTGGISSERRKRGVGPSAPLHVFS